MWCGVLECIGKKVGQDNMFVFGRTIHFTYFFFRKAKRDVGLNFTRAVWRNGIGLTLTAKRNAGYVYLCLGLVQCLLSLSRYRKHMDPA